MNIEKVTLKAMLEYIDLWETKLRYEAKHGENPDLWTDVSDAYYEIRNDALLVDLVYLYQNESDEL